MDYKQALCNFVQAVDQKKRLFSDYDEGGSLEVDGNAIQCSDWIGQYSCAEADPAKDYGQIMIPEDLNGEGYRAICDEVLGRVFDDAIKSMNQNGLEQELTDYAFSFAEQVKREWPCLADVGLTGMTVIFSTRSRRDNEGNREWSIGGDYSAEKDLIRIFSIDARDNRPGIRTEQERTIRHEVLHRMLCRAGLAHQDESFSFWFFATVYDAYAYKLMDEPNKRLYDQLMTFYKQGMAEMINEAFRQARGR